MHVLIIPSWYPRHPDDIGGSFFREQALALYKHGCKVGVISPQLHSLKNWQHIFSDSSGISFEQDEGVATYRSNGMNWFPRMETLNSKLFTWHGMRLFSRYIEENGTPDIVHVHSLLYAGLVAEKIYKKNGVPFVVTEHSSAFSRNLVSAKGLSIAKRTAALASRKFAVSAAFAKILNNTVSSETNSWEELPNAVSEKFTSHTLKIKNEKEYFEFINVALMNENKKQANIIHAFAAISKTHQDIKLTIVGDGPEKSRLEKLTCELGVAEKVKFTGLLPREKVMHAMATADAFVLSSRHETFGVVIIEALALGKPVIATHCGGPDSIVRKEDGLLIPVDDINSLTQAMVFMIHNKKQYDPLNIRQSCHERYSEIAIAKRLKIIYSGSLLNEE